MGIYSVGEVFMSALFRGLCVGLLMGLFFQPGAYAAPNQSPSHKTAQAFERLKSNPTLLLDFLTRMPKGGDLHHHLTGAVYAESFIDWAAGDGRCIDRASFIVSDPPCDDQTRPSARLAQTNFDFRNLVIDAWSIRNFVPTATDRSVDYHFFRTFQKFDPATKGHFAEALAEVTHRAGVQNVLYLETMIMPDQGAAMSLGAKLGWLDDFGAMRDRLMANGMDTIIAQGSKNLDDGLAKARAISNCDGPMPDRGCGVTTRFLYVVLRALPREVVFAQMVAAFEFAVKDPRMVGINPAMPEDEFTAMADFQLHMRMFDYLHGLYPQVHLSLHAGELVPGQVPPEGLTSHIRDSINLGHAARIGHGHGVAYETDAPGLMAQMARQHIAVETTLTTEQVLGAISNVDHPLPAYRAAGVPVILATDDEGVGRTQLTWEYRKAVEAFGLNYPALKQMARDSLDYSFLPGASLWAAPEKYRGPYLISGPCRGLDPAARPNAACANFLAANEKANIEWRQEAEFGRFEAGF
jgi:adenosine deaminase